MRRCGQYQACVDLLRRELGTEPEEETRRVYEESLAGSTRERQPTETAPARPPLIGREADLARLHGTLAEIRRGTGRLVAMLGEAGIGKTRLVQEVVATATREGMRVLTGRCYETMQILPFSPWSDALRAGHVIPDDPAVRTLNPVWRNELVRLFPELGPPGASVTSEETSTRLFEAVVQLCRRLAKREPCLLVLEDLHWSDEMSLRLVAFLARRLGDWRLGVLATTRAEDLAETSLLRRVLRELEAESGFETLTLGPLSERQTVHLVRTLVGGGSAGRALDRISERVWEMSAGNPFVVVEATRALADQDVGAAGAIPIPGRVRELISDRLGRLTADARELAGVAALVGSDLDPLVLQHAADLTDRQAANGLEEVIRRRILHGIGERLEFVHDRIRDVVYESVLEPRRRVLHGEVGRALERLYADRLDEVSDRLAYHYARGGEADKAVEYLARLALRATQVHAHAEAAAALAQALGHVALLPAGEAQAHRRAELVLRRAASLSFLGRIDDVRRLLVDERRRIETVADPGLTSRFYVLLGHTLSLLGDPDAAVAAARRALDEAERRGDPDTLGKAHFVLALEAFWSGPFRKGIEHGRQAVELLAPRARGRWLGLAHWVEGVNYTLLGEFGPALRAEAEVDVIGEATHDAYLRSTAAWTTGGIHALAGDSQEAIDACLRGLEWSPDPPNTTFAQAWLGYAYLSGNDFPGRSRCSKKPSGSTESSASGRRDGSWRGSPKLI